MVLQVGPKVADCVVGPQCDSVSMHVLTVVSMQSLMSLDKMDAIPVDTHVWQIAKRDYHFRASTRSLTPATYDAIGDLFRRTFREYSGWAHSVPTMLFLALWRGWACACCVGQVLFAADLDRAWKRKADNNNRMEGKLTFQASTTLQKSKRAK